MLQIVVVEFNLKAIHEGHGREVTSMQPYLGEIRLLPWNWAPRGWGLCNGAILPISQYTALFSLLGTMYGGNGQTNFALPNLQGRTPIHRSSIYSQGEMDGEENVTLTLATMAMHQHAFVGTSATATSKTAVGTFGTDTSAPASYYAVDTNPLAISPASIGVTGGNMPHDNMQPYLVMSYCIAMLGVFPSRN
jgi:microcystin-dependent protein